MTLVCIQDATHRTPVQRRAWPRRSRRQTLAGCPIPHVRQNGVIGAAANAHIPQGDVANIEDVNGPRNRRPGGTRRGRRAQIAVREGYILDGEDRGRGLWSVVVE